MKQKQKGFKICQSCGMPIVKVKEYGVNADRTRNKEYCCYCFSGGKFTEPKITLEQMINRVAVVMAKKMALTEEQARVLAARMMPELKRWKK